MNKFNFLAVLIFFSFLSNISADIPEVNLKQECENCLCENQAGIVAGLGRKLPVFAGLVPGFIFDENGNADVMFSQEVKWGKGLDIGFAPTFVGITQEILPIRVNICKSGFYKVTVEGVVLFSQPFPLPPTPPPPIILSIISSQGSQNIDEIPKGVNIQAGFFYNLRTVMSIYDFSHIKDGCNNEFLGLRLSNGVRLTGIVFSGFKMIVERIEPPGCKVEGCKTCGCPSCR